MGMAIEDVIKEFQDILEEKRGRGGFIWTREQEALNRAIFVLSKFVPDKPIRKKEKVLGYEYICPDCGQFLCSDSEKHCPCCGKRIDWEPEMSFDEAAIEKTMKEVPAE